MSSQSPHAEPNTTAASTPQAAQAPIAGLVRDITRVVRGHPDVVRMVLAAILARGHVLLEDVPGVGKTTLARCFAKVLGCSFSRIQFTADMLPADVVGVQVLDPQHGKFVFKKGPIFAEVVLADEINRASPKTQSAMLEAMGEAHVTVDDVSYALPPVFCVLATQNPVEHHGAYPLPESQLDRFMVRLSLGYPPAQDELGLLLEPDSPQHTLRDLTEVLGPARLRALQALVPKVHVSEAVARYALAWVEATRQHPDILLGVSPRGSVALSRMARAWALVNGRDHVLPDDIKALAGPALGHRLMLGGGVQAATLLQTLSDSLPVPR